MKKVALAAIRGYRSHLSPRKGFSCAHRVHAGGESCSAYGYRVIERYGVTMGMRLLRRRLDACAARHHQEQQRRAVRPAPARLMHAKTQGGFCKCGVCERPCVNNCANFLGDGLFSDQPCTWEWSCAPRRKHNKWTVETKRRDPTRPFISEDSDSDSDAESDRKSDD